MTSQYNCKIKASISLRFSEELSCSSGGMYCGLVESLRAPGADLSLFSRGGAKGFFFCQGGAQFCEKYTSLGSEQLMKISVFFFQNSITRIA